MWERDGEGEREVLRWEDSGGEWGGWVMREEGVNGHPQVVLGEEGV